MNGKLSEKGIYTLIIQCQETTIQVGALGPLNFNGTYLYVGSALGPGGLKRIKRHIEVSTGERDVERWHVDYLLKNSRLVGYAYTETTRDVECDVARNLDKGNAVKSFGCSDCSCKSHLIKTDGEKDSIKQIKMAYQKNNLKPKINLLDDG
ncbi:DUF123 domain-containing protein [Methanonatronarchaeum sp. AMET6-2]|uniref:GIY-YIG nuclease family protein n=1 Tax=Methanonatronarchaeum sp. AMET6-2 TaxID=2933293 RepID=UPI00120A1CF0|nr:GIY-YIG nuclease family protein [Methanonatronarchaeum sp. AMET6-2]RZN63185.1 MAG: GIY-YIG nuclease family protein [Methanonatronarchaeia archaeon]UOY09450.1 GIY-YIG nuclease family protein [Methanonatronarchaeum sp. AMET6-2]